MLTNEQPGSRASRADFKLLDEQVRQTMQSFKVPGVAVGVMLGDLEYSAGFGVTNLDHPLPVTPDTLFQIGSITKTVTATVMMRLVEAGKIDLDATVRHYLPTFKVKDEEASAKVKVRDLFIHTAGWTGDVSIDTGSGDDASARFMERMAELEQVHPLGQAFSYNNASLRLAGRIIEVVTGQVYEQAVRELLFEPLKMQHAYFLPSEVMVHRFAAGHIVFPDGPRVANPWPLFRASSASGGVITAIPDLFRYACFHMGDGTAVDDTRLLKPESLAYMQSPIYEINKHGDRMGLAWMLQTVGGEKIVKHGGTTNGQQAELLLVPEQKFALAITTNSNSGRQLINAVEKWALQHFLGAADPEPTYIELPAAKLAQYASTYQAHSSRVEISLKEGRLYVEILPNTTFNDDAPPIPPPSLLQFTDPDTAYATEGVLQGTRLEFSRRDDGSIEWVRMGLRIARRESQS